jgi:hypothetical protein
VRGRALRVDVLTPQVGSAASPVPIARFRTAAQPLRHLDYLIEEPQQAALVAGSGILVNVPSPARFALPKLVVSRSRPATQQTKSAKDLDQAAQIIEQLASDRPGDLALAWGALAKRKSLATVARAGRAVLSRRHSEAHDALISETGQ